MIEYIPLEQRHINYLEKNDEGTDETRERGEYTALNGLGSVVAYEGNSNQKYLAWMVNIMGRIKVHSQTVNSGTARWLGYSLCYIVLVLQTLFFIWTYLKRVLYLAFLTVIAPLVAMTYPLDKINDGQAQAFNSWLKEYIFNLLIQPLHLLLYSILIVAASKLAITNPVYAIVAIGFMMPAEKLMRNFFGFNKAKTPGALGGAAGAALAFTGVQKMINFGKKSAGKYQTDKDKNENSKIRYKNGEGVDSKGVVAESVLGKKTTPGSNSQDVGERMTREQKDKNIEAQGTRGGGQQQEEGRKEAIKHDVARKKKENTDRNEEKQKKNKKRKINVATAVAGRYKRILGKRMANRIKKMRPIRALARGVTGAAGAATFGMAGLALGIASGDASKAFQYTTAGVAGGYGVGKAIGGSAADALHVNPEKIEDEMKMAYYGEDYKKIKFEESVREMASDDKNIDTIRKLTGLSYNESQQVLNSVGRTCYGSGITDMEDIAAVYKMGQKGHSIDEGIAALKFNRQLPADLNKMGEDERNDHIARWQREYEEADYENPKLLANKTMELAETINKIKSGLKKA